MSHEPLNLTADRPSAFHAFPSLVSDGRGGVWVAWVAFEDRRDEVLARQVCAEAGGHALSPIETVSERAGAHLWPSALADDERVHVVWARASDGRWEVRHRERRGEGWGPETCVSGTGSAWQPAAALDTAGEPWVAWAGAGDGRIELARPGCAPEVVAPGPGGGRPCVACAPGCVAVAWDRYDGGAYDVHCRLRLSSGEWLPPARVSAGPGNALCPQLGVGEDGSVFCCWVAAEDVADSRGILDQHHRVRCARLTGGQWLPTGDGEEGTVADLAHGLLPRRAIWGYLGRRRRPFFRRDERGRLWLLWERKTDPDAETREGELLGRAYVGDRWDPPVRLAEGFAYYVVEETAAGSAPQWLARRAAWGRAAWDLQVTRGAVLRARPGDGAAPATEPGDWRDWRPTALPEALALPTAPPPVTIGDEDYDLYFGDLHAHTTLSADAEGEVDELYHYARDKACLDFVALVDNDCYQCPMTASEFEVAMTCAELYDDPGRFVALRGYEWTRWDRERESHPDHRTVLFPADGDIFRHVDAGTPANSDLAREVEARGGLLLSQHWDWTLTDGAAEAGLEVCSAWDYYVDRPGPFHRELVAARRLAFIGGSDSHRRNPGTGGALTGVYARELTRAGIFEALRARRVYATSGSRIALDFRVNGTPMGGEVACSGAPVLTVSVRGTRPLRSLAVVRGVVGGAVEEVQPVRVQTLAGETAEVRWADESCPSATVFYYVIARQEGEDVRYPSNLVVAQGCRAWSSPTWVRRG